MSTITCANITRMAQGCSFSNTHLESNNHMAGQMTSLLRADKRPEDCVTAVTGHARNNRVVLAVRHSHIQGYNYVGKLWTICTLPTLVLPSL